MTGTAWHVLLLVLGAAAFLAAVLIPDPPNPLSAIRLRLVAAGLLAWILVAVLVAAGAL